MEKLYRVATFYQRRDGRAPLVTAYTRDYNPAWPDCHMFDVHAESGTEAKRIAMRMRREIEESRPTAEENDESVELDPLDRLPEEPDYDPSTEGLT